MTRHCVAAILIILTIISIGEAGFLLGVTNTTLAVNSWTTSVLTLSPSGSLSSIRVGFRIEKTLTSSLYVFLVPAGSTWIGNLSEWNVEDRFANADVTSGNILLIGGAGSDNDFGVIDANSTSFNSSSYLRFSTSTDPLYPARNGTPGAPFGDGLTGLYTPIDTNNEGKLWNLYGTNQAGDWTLVVGVDGSINAEEGLLYDWFIDTNVCGDGILTSSEQCDGGEGCDPATCLCPADTAANGQGGCAPPVCGDGRVAYPNETCDGGLGCLGTCRCASGFIPATPPGKNCEVAPTSTWTSASAQVFASNSFTVLTPITIDSPGTLQWLRIGMFIEHPDTRQLYVYLQPPGVTWAGDLGAFDYDEAYTNRDDAYAPVMLFAERGSVSPPSRNLGNLTAAQPFYVTFNLLELFTVRELPRFFKSDTYGSYFPPNKNQTNKLSALQGWNITGDWTLIIGDSSIGGDGLARSVISWTLESLVCGDGKVTLVDDCDGGEWCTASCKCENGYQRTNPISLGCVATVIEPGTPSDPPSSEPTTEPSAPSNPDSPLNTPAALNDSVVIPPPAPTPEAGVKPEVIIIATIVPVVGVAIGAVLFIYFWRYKKRKKEGAERLEDTSSSSPGSVALTPVLKPPNSPIYTSISSKNNVHANRITGRGDTMNKTQTGHMKLNVPYSELIFLQEIGAGGFSRVHIGEWQRTTVALKVSTSSTSEFYREATLMVNMRPHPNVVQILGLSTDGPFPALILEYCSGGSLDKLLKDKEKEVTDAYRLRIISGVSKGMYHLHKANIVHRDLAARNILLSGDGEPKVSDFGLSRPLSETLVGTTKSNIGPIRWMAPESLSFNEYSKASDIWSFGIVVWEIITRKEPHTDIDPIEVGVRIRDEHLVPPIPEDCDPMWRDLMLKCWNTDPEQRPTFDDICDEIERHRRTLEMRELASRG
jgi:subtilisin-like proprotein convertase family protein